MLKRLFSCNRHVESYDKTQPDPRGTYADRRLPDGALCIPEGDYRFYYTYPLSRQAVKTHHLTAETTAQELLAIGAEDYRAIYAEEEAAAGPTGHVPGMLNRAKSEGPYGIWGHDITDLYFEGVEADFEGKRIEFVIGS